MNIKDIMLSERRYSQKGGMRYDSTCIMVNHIATENRMVVARDQVRRKWGVVV